MQLWLAGLGRQDQVSLLTEKIKVIQSAFFYTEEEKGLATTQAFIQIVDNTIQNPHIATHPAQIQLLSIEGSKTLTVILQIQLQNAGFTKAHVFLDKQPDGISFSDNSFVFWSQGGFITHTLYITLEALQLVKDKVYDMKILIETEFENLSVPFQIKVIFPKKAYLLQVLKYALFGFLFFAIIRYFIGVITGNNSWFLSALDNFSYRNNYFAYFIGLVLLLSGMIGSVFLIRKIEKI